MMVTIAAQTMSTASKSPPVTAVASPLTAAHTDRMPDDDTFAESVWEAEGGRLRRDEVR